MLYRDLKKVANEALFNPKKPDKNKKILLDVGNPSYWITKAIEKLMEAKCYSEGSAAYHKALLEATELILLTRAFVNEQTKKPEKTRKCPTRSNSQTTTTT